MRMPRTLGLAVLLAATTAVAAGCRDATGPDLLVQFSARSIGNLVYDSAAVSVESGVIIVAGVVTVPTPCDSLNAQAERVGTTITLDLDVRTSSTSAGCYQVVEARSYTARLAPLAAGQYAVIVRHAAVHGREVTRAMVTVP